jgi:hypothetical protein
VASISDVRTVEVWRLESLLGSGRQSYAACHETRWLGIDGDNAVRFPHGPE